MVPLASRNGKRTESPLAAAGLNFTLASDLLRNARDVSRVVAITPFGGNSLFQGRIYNVNDNRAFVINR